MTTQPKTRTLVVKTERLRTLGASSLAQVAGGSGGARPPESVTVCKP